jgi:large subunit ribosomal protein L25
MERAEIQAESRTILGKQVKQLRAKSWTPAVLYGPDTPAKALQLQNRTLERTLERVGSTALIDLYLDNSAKPYVVLARRIQRQPLTGELQHVDFYQVRLTEKVRTHPRLELRGEPLLVQAGRAVLIHAMNTIEVECLPTDLIDSIQVDASALQTLEDNLTVKDLVVPAGVTILADPNEVVASLVPTRLSKAEIEGTAEEGAEEES